MFLWFLFASVNLFRIFCTHFLYQPPLSRFTSRRWVVRLWPSLNVLTMWIMMMIIIVTDEEMDFSISFFRISTIVRIFFVLSSALVDDNERDNCHVTCTFLYHLRSLTWQCHWISKIYTRRFKEDPNRSGNKYIGQCSVCYETVRSTSQVSCAQSL